MKYESFEELFEAIKDNQEKLIGYRNLYRKQIDILIGIQSSITYESLEIPEKFSKYLSYQTKSTVTGLIQSGVASNIKKLQQNLVAINKQIKYLQGK